MSNKKALKRIAKAKCNTIDKLSKENEKLINEAKRFENAYKYSNYLLGELKKGNDTMNMWYKTSPELIEMVNQNLEDDPISPNHAIKFINGLKDNLRNSSLELSQVRDELTESQSQLKQTLETLDDFVGKFARCEADLMQATHILKAVKNNGFQVGYFLREDINKFLDKQGEGVELGTAAGDTCNRNYNKCQGVLENKQYQAEKFKLNYVGCPLCKWSDIITKYEYCLRELETLVKTGTKAGETCNRNGCRGVMGEQSFDNKGKNTMAFCFKCGYHSPLNYTD